MKKTLRKSQIVSLIEDIDGQSALVRNAKSIVAHWDENAAETVTWEIMYEAFFASLNVDLSLLSKDEAHYAGAVRNLLLDHWMNITEWRAKRFWKQLDNLQDKMTVRNPEVYDIIAKKLAPWVCKNHKALERVFFDTNVNEALRTRSSGFNYAISLLFRKFNDVLATNGKSLPWSEEFITELFASEGFIDHMVEWADYERLPTQLKFDFSVVLIREEAFARQAVTAAWIESRGVTQEQRVQLAATAAVCNYKRAVSYLKNHHPELVKKIEIGKDLQLSPEEILDTLFVPVQLVLEVPDDFNVSLDSTQ